MEAIRPSLAAAFCLDASISHAVRRQQVVPMSGANRWTKRRILAHSIQVFGYIWLTFCFFWLFFLGGEEVNVLVGTYIPYMDRYGLNFDLPDVEIGRSTGTLVPCS